MTIIKSPSPNFYSRQGYKPELIVVHITEGYFPSDLQYLRNPAPIGGVGPVSAHDLIAPDGTIHELVDWQYGAWHAGRVLNPTAKLLKKNWLGSYINPNYYSYGIEVSCMPPAAPTPMQLTALKERLKERLTLFQLPTDRDHVIGHREIFSGKTCPGPINLDQIVIELTLPTSIPTVTMVDKEMFKQQIINLIKEL